MNKIVCLLITITIIVCSDVSAHAVAVYDFGGQHFYVPLGDCQPEGSIDCDRYPAYFDGQLGIHGVDNIFELQTDHTYQSFYDVTYRNIYGDFLATDSYNGLVYAYEDFYKPSSIFHFQLNWENGAILSTMAHEFHWFGHYNVENVETNGGNAYGGGYVEKFELISFPVPETSTILLLGGGFLGVVLFKMKFSNC